MTLAQETSPSYAQVYAERFPDLDVLGLVAEHVDLGDDPGGELVDHDGLTADDLTETLLAPATLVTSSQRVDLANDYEWSTWLADVLRAAGCNVIEYPGWKTRGRPRSVGRWQPRGVLWHHDASTIGPSPYVAKYGAETGRPPGTPAPLMQAWVCMGCKGAHRVGTWHVLAAGRANHGGEGNGWGAIPKDAANAATIGVETDNTTGEPTPPAMYAELVKGTAAIMRRLRSTPARLLAGHKEYAEGRKPDPDDIDMNRGRSDVAREMLRQEGQPVTPPAPKPPAKPAPAKPTKPTPAVRLKPFPGAARFQLGRRSAYVTQLGRWLLEAGYAKYHDGNGYQPGPTFTEYDLRNVQAFQRSRAALRGDADGYPGPKTWALLQQAAAARQKRPIPV